MPVRIRLEQSGGFAAIPGLTRPVEIDTADLDPDEKATLEWLVHRTGILEGSLRAVAGTSTGADLREYRVTVDDGDLVRTVQLRDPLRDESVAALIQHLQSSRLRPT
jgi:Emfourin